MPTEIHVGTPPRKYKHKEALQVELCTVNFHNFRGLPYEEDIDSPQFECFGHFWKLQIRKTSEAQLGAHLILDKSRSAHKISGDFIIRIGESPSRPSTSTEKFPFDTEFIEEDDDVGNAFGLPNLALIDHILDHGLDPRYGTLAIKLEMRLLSDDRIINLCGEEDQLRKSMNNILYDDATADVAFEIKGELIYAHLNILKAMAPEFVYTLNLDEEGKHSYVQIEDVTPEVFRIMLEYIYGSTTILIGNPELGKAVIDAADKYGMESLKLAAEKSYVECNNLTADTVAETLLYADGKNCHVLKSVAMDYVHKNMDDVVASSSFSSLHQSEQLTKEIMVSLAKRARLN